MSDTPLVRKYISSVDGMAHQCAIEIIMKAEAENAALREQLAAAQQQTRLERAKVVREIATKVKELCADDEDSMLYANDIDAELAKLTNVGTVLRSGSV